MNASEIISQYAQKLGLDINATLSEVKKLIDSPNGLAFQENDSVFLLNKLDKGVTAIHLFTSDSPQMFLMSVRNAVAKIKSSGITKIYGESENEDLANALDQLGVQVSKSDNPEYAWSAII